MDDKWEGREGDKKRLNKGQVKLGTGRLQQIGSTAEDFYGIKERWRSSSSDVKSDRCVLTAIVWGSV